MYINIYLYVCIHTHLRLPRIERVITAARSDCNAMTAAEYNGSSRNSLGGVQR